MAIDDYHVDWNQCLGTGSFGVVYVGSHISTGKQVAIKIIEKDKCLWNTVYKELLALKAIKHDNIVEILDVFMEKKFYAIFEYCGEGNLETFFGKKKPTLQDKLKIMYQCASALDYLHNQKPPIVHRGLKPGSIVLKKNASGVGVVKLCGFGWSIILDEGDMPITTDGGTLSFRAPELLIKKNNKYQYTSSVDVFALGLVFKAILDYECENRALELMKVKIQREDHGEEMPYAMAMKMARQENRKRPALFVMRAEDDDLMLQLKVLATNMTAYNSNERPKMAHVKEFLGILGQNKSHKKQMELLIELLSKQEDLREENIQLRKSIDDRNHKYAYEKAELCAEIELLTTKYGTCGKSQRKIEDKGDVHRQTEIRIPVRENSGQAEPPYFEVYAKQEQWEDENILYQQPATSEIFLQKLLELEKSIHEAIKECTQKTEIAESLQSNLVYIWKQHIQEHIESLHDLMSMRHKQMSRKPTVEPEVGNEIPSGTQQHKRISLLDKHQRKNGLSYEAPQNALDDPKDEPQKQYNLVSRSDSVGQSDEMTEDAKTLVNNYKLFLADLESSPVMYIQTVYKDMERKKIVVDIEKGNHNVTCEALQNLQNSKEYYEYLYIMECELGELLMQADHLSDPVSVFPPKDQLHYNIRIGSGSLIGCVNVCGAELQGILKDKDMKCIDDICKKYPTTTKGTLTCIVKQRAKYYTMTAQHVLDKEQFFSNQKQVFSQVHYECDELLLADTVHLASCYSGLMDTISVNGSKKAVDVGLMPISQSHLDETLLNQLPVYYRAEFESTTPDSSSVLMHKHVKKLGAITRKTEGKIISTDCMAKLDPKNVSSPQGEMFAVVGLINNTKPFAEQGDSGSLVTIELNRFGIKRQYALGIIAQRRHWFLGRENVTLCVRMEDCLKALESATELGKSIDSRTFELYVGFLRPFASVHDRKMPHVEVNNTSITDVNMRVCVYLQSV